MSLEYLEYTPKLSMRNVLITIFPDPHISIYPEVWKSGNYGNQNTLEMWKS